tara:strand:- start:307 stop:1332 length:1026 start_codon:yes stop_codon:yes gene_type:complete
LYSFFLKKDKIFFCENAYTFEYLKPIIENQLLKKNKSKISVISHKKINLNKNKFNEIHFNYDFFLEFFFLTLNSNYIYSTTPGLGENLFKKSLFNKSAKYIYIQHSNISLTMGYHQNAFINFDAIQVINSYQNNEAQLIRDKYKKRFKIFKSKYYYLKKFTKNENSSSKKIDFLIAPTWNTNFFANKIYLKIINQIAKKNFSYLLRPHPMSFKKKEISYEELNNNNIMFDTKSKVDLTKYRFLVSDWSGIFIEFFLVNGIKSILFNTTPKVLNKNFEYYRKTPIEIDLRKYISVVFEHDNLKEFDKLLSQLENNELEILQITDSIKEKCSSIFYENRLLDK